MKTQQTPRRTLYRSPLGIPFSGFFGAAALRALGLAIVAVLTQGKVAQAGEATALVPFQGEKTSWHGFDRYDFLLNEETLAIEPADPGVRGDVPGRRRCIVVGPKTPATGNPWSWRGCYWDHEPQAEIELVRRGFHLAYITANAQLRPDKKWDAWYEFLTTKHGLSRKPAFIGMSRGGEFAYTWAGAHPSQVSCIYADNPGPSREVFAHLGDLAAQDVPLLEICGSFDPLLGRCALPIETIYQQFGGRVTLMTKEGAGHHPHSLRDPKPIADFIERSVTTAPSPLPEFTTAGTTHASFYGAENAYREFRREGTSITCRGPEFVECYDRYAFNLPNVEGSVDVIVPRKTAAGRPWIFRAGFAGRDAVVDLALLARGFHIVTGPVPYNADGPSLAHWEAVYKHLVAHGFSAKPVMEGAGGAAGEVYAWAIAQPGKVAGVYAENPIFRAKMTNMALLEGLAALAREGVPLLHVCGALDPALESDTRAAEKLYQSLGGRLTVIVNPGEGHFLSRPVNLAPVMEFMTRAAAVTNSLPSTGESPKHGSASKGLPRQMRTLCAAPPSAHTEVGAPSKACLAG